MPIEPLLEADATAHEHGAKLSRDRLMDEERVLYGGNESRRQSFP